MNVNPCTTKLGWIIWPSFSGPKFIEVTILYHDSQQNIPALQRKPKKE
jgi:hypothetical protein